MFVRKTERSHFNFEKDSAASLYICSLISSRTDKVTLPARQHTTDHFDPACSIRRKDKVPQCHNQSPVFADHLDLVCGQLGASENYVAIELVKTVAINLLTSIDPSNVNKMV
ncbi:hypothetical protein E2C01_054973 [Portunus trituberculatus]|uniref:Uncharacterized protein n=1 Tax=Portunus trituberculatus TaxID=210409 RepID=A0A5B7GTG4_PORTR|nr:hypothetical protein [Portunus trituberculatus]